VNALLAASGAAVVGAAAGPALTALARSTLRRGRLGRGAVALASGCAGAAAGLVVLRWSGTPWLLPGELAFAAAGVALGAVDLAELRLPNVLVLPAAGAVALLLGGGALVAGVPSAAVGVLVGALALALVYLVLAIAARGRLGMGDVKLGLVAGAATGALGLHVWLLALVAGVLVNGLVALVVLLLRRRRALGASIPFGPSIVLGALLAVLIG